jgi:glutamine---fructose-6-phosphate transaminase (isomerizing)
VKVVTTALDRMIAAQPEVLEQIAGMDLSAPARLLGDARRIFLVGTGTSQHAAELGAELLSNQGLDARWATGVQFARSTAPLLSGDAVVVITHTAETAYAARSRAKVLASAAAAGLVSITGAGRGWPEAVETPTHEESETYTVSYTAVLAVLARLAHHLGTPGTTTEDLHQVAARVRELCADPAIESVPVPARALALVGPGPWGVTAREGALKLREGARTLAEGFDAERLLHGEAVPYTAADGLILLQPSADPDGMTAALGVAAQAEGIPVSTLEESWTPSSTLLAQIPMTVRLQLLAARFAGLRRQDPDTAIVGGWAQPHLWQIGALEAQ